MFSGSKRFTHSSRAMVSRFIVNTAHIIQSRAVTARIRNNSNMEPKFLKVRDYGKMVIFNLLVLT